MAIRAVSHVAIGVREMERSLRFYRDALGLRVKFDTLEELPGFSGAEARRRRAVYLGFGEGPDASFVVLDQPLSTDPVGQPAELFQTGIHHFSFWVDDIDAIAARVRAELTRKYGQLPPSEGGAWLFQVTSRSSS